MKRVTQTRRLADGCCCHGNRCHSCITHGSPELSASCDEHANQADEIIPPTCRFDCTGDTQ